MFLLALFALGLGIAQALVIWYQRVQLSSPVPLGQTGLAVPLPTGPGWTTAGAWRLGPRGPVLEARLQHAGVEAEVQCHYRPSDEPISTRQQLAQELEENGYPVVNSGRLRLGQTEMLWVQTEGRSSGRAIFLAVVSLNQAVLELRVSSLDSELARRVFMAVGERIRYRPPRSDPSLSA